MGKTAKRYKPSALLSVAKVTPVAVFVAVNLAPGTTAPEGSETVPSNSPAPVCAHMDGAVRASTMHNRPIALRSCFMRSPPYKLPQGTVALTSDRGMQLLSFLQTVLLFPPQ